ncbi:hypothetical protein H312_00861 [Anncaliia algerae PRA339]|uniref:Uncharacterized protein n=1 Tax=Anncaliia algerae PRA339 TaxID=1288291 RepID=A0A059F334_9MICR|nr:hypothetical protein H312_00861 [Anncaliia algerae PRA339]
MEEKNKKLAEKNTQLKIELDELQIKQRKLLRENLNSRFFNNIMHQKMLNMLENNLENIENALENTKKMKEEIHTKDESVNSNLQENVKTDINQNILNESRNKNIDAVKKKKKKRRLNMRRK